MTVWETQSLFDDILVCHLGASLVLGLLCILFSLALILFYFLSLFLSLSLHICAYISIHIYISHVADNSISFDDVLKSFHISMWHLKTICFSFSFCLLIFSVNSFEMQRMWMKRECECVCVSVPCTSEASIEFITFTRLQLCDGIWKTAREAYRRSLWSWLTTTLHHRSPQNILSAVLYFAASWPYRPLSCALLVKLSCASATNLTEFISVIINRFALFIWLRIKNIHIFLSVFVRWLIIHIKHLLGFFFHSRAPSTSK